MSAAACPCPLARSSVRGESIQKLIELLRDRRRDRLAVRREAFEIDGYRLSDVLQSLRACRALRDAPRQRRYFRDEHAVLVLLNQHAILHTPPPHDGSRLSRKIIPARKPCFIIHWACVSDVYLSFALAASSLRVFHSTTCQCSTPVLLFLRRRRRSAIASRSKP